MFFLCSTFCVFLSILWVSTFNNIKISVSRNAQYLYIVYPPFTNITFFWYSFWYILILKFSFLGFQVLYVQRKELTGRERWFHLISEPPPLSSITAVCPPGFHAAPPAGKRVHAPGISPESPEEGGGQEDALPRFHHERMASQFPWFFTKTRSES